MTGHAQLKLTRTAGFSLDVAFDIPEDGVTALFLSLIHIPSPRDV